MKMESGLKHFSPQGMLINDDTKSTSPDRLNGTDIMYAFGATSRRARFGLAAYLGKTGVSQSDGQQAFQALARYAMDVAPKSVRKAAGDHFGWAMLILAQFAFADYSRSAATTATCTTCNGSGKATRTQVTRKVSYPCGPAPFWASKSRAVRPSDWEHWENVSEIVPAKCETCEGKGELSARCRCGGKGEVLDRIATKERGAPVFKTCERCGGNGFSKMSSATVHRVILTHLPDLHQSSWSRNWKPFYEVLVDIFHEGERQASQEFEKVTRL